MGLRGTKACSSRQKSEQIQKSPLHLPHAPVELKLYKSEARAMRRLMPCYLAVEEAEAILNRAKPW